MKFRTPHSIALALLLSSLSLPLLGVVQAADGDGTIGARPANPRSDNPRSSSIFTYTLGSGETYKDAIDVFNNSTVTKTISVYAVDSELSSGGVFACAQAVQKKTSVGAWVNLEQSSVTLATKEHQVVPFTLAVPSNQSVGEHNGCIVIQDTSDTAKKEVSAGVSLSFRSAFRVAVTIPGEIIKKLDTPKISLIKSTTDSITLQSSVYNSGNVSIDTTTDTTVKNFLGKTIFTDGGNYPVLSGTTATWNYTVPAVFWGGRYALTTTVAYKADTSSELGKETGSQTTLSSPSTYVWVRPMPLALLAYLLLGLGLGFLLGVLILSRRHKKVVAKKWSSHVVLKGETIESIAKNYTISWKKLAQANGLKAPYTLSAHATLKVPSKK